MKFIGNPHITLHEDGYDTISIRFVGGRLEFYRYGDEVEVRLDWSQLQELFNYAASKWGDKEGGE